MPNKTVPEFEPPVMAESAKAPFDSPDWIFEIKLDGYRAIAGGRKLLRGTGRSNRDALMPEASHGLHFSFASVNYNKILKGTIAKNYQRLWRI
jgi:hypothetical protein